MFPKHVIFGNDTNSIPLVQGDPGNGKKCVCPSCYVSLVCMLVFIGLFFSFSMRNDGWDPSTGYRAGCTQVIRKKK